MVRPEEPAEDPPAEEPVEEPEEEDWKVCMGAPVVEILHAEEGVQGAVELVVHSRMRAAVWPVPPEDEQEEEAQAEVTRRAVLVGSKTI